MNDTPTPPADTFTIPADSLEHLNRLETQWNADRTAALLEAVSQADNREAQEAAFAAALTLERHWTRYRDAVLSHWSCLVQVAYSTGRVAGTTPDTVTEIPEPHAPSSTRTH